MTLQVFSYEAIQRDGSHVKGTVEADSKLAASGRIQEQGGIPLEILAAGTGLNREIAIFGKGKKPKHAHLVIFCRQFATMVASGLSIVRVLSILAEQTAQPRLKAAVREVLDDVQAGGALSEALAAQSDIFPAIMIHMVRAGETGGFLDRALERVAGLLEAEARLRARVRGAMTYPVVVLALTFVIVTAMLLFVVPTFQTMLSGLGGALPLPTAILIAVSHNMIWLLPLSVVVVAALVFLFRSKMKNEEFRVAVHTLMLRIPVFGPLAKKIQMTRFARNLSLMMGAGVTLLPSLEIVADSSTNARVGRIVREVAQGVQEGKPMSDLVGGHPDVFPPMVAQMMQVGEDTGQLESMLGKVADFYDLEVETTTDQLASLLEPMLIVILGLVIGSMVISLYLPMFSLYTQLDK
jgi:type IV pilus assembly protein PilC